MRTRPTSDRLRQAVFNVIGPRTEGARILDICAGTGAVGLEGLSRGAAHATFIERDREALACLQANVRHLDAAARTRILGGDAPAVLEELHREGARFDCAFLDPPYEEALTQPCIEVLARGGLLSENALLIVQTFHKTALPERIASLARTWNRRYGETGITIYQKERECR
jgi:16S rRNA (guanine966-N2)-methyltransferase